MPLPIYMIKFILFFAFTFCSILLIGQEKKIRIIQADKLQYDEQIKEAQQLIGNVIFEHDSAYMYCDTALLYVKSNSFEAFSGVKIIQGDSIQMTGDTVVYSGEEKIARLKGNIHFSDGKLQLVTNQLDYDLTTKIGSYTNGATITSLENNNVLISKIGSYHSDAKTLFFKDSVRLTNPKYVIESDTLTYNTESEVSYFHGATTITSDSNFIYCEHGWYDTQNEKAAFWQNSYLETKEQRLSGDSIFYDRTAGIGEAFGNVLIQDTTNKVDIQGGYAFYNEIIDSSLVTDCPVFVQYFEKDTLYLVADTLSIQQDSTTSLKLFRAYHNVLLHKPDLQASCDSLIYSETDSMMYFMKTPIIWSDNNQLSGKKINIRTFNGNVKQLYINKKATIISEADSLNANHFNQIQGKTIEGLFNDENKLETVFVKGNGEVIYFMGEDQKPLTDMNHTQCAEMKILLKSNEIDKIKFYNKPTASLKAIIEVNEADKKLSQFSWNTEKRPQSPEDILD
jgi:lipopolysaccharide export system protein LptA